MCCISGKMVSKDVDYVRSCFAQKNARTPETAVTYAELGMKTSEHMFARDHFLSLLRDGDILRTDTGAYYFPNLDQEKFSQCSR